MRTVLCTSLSAGEGPHFELLHSAGFQCRMADRDISLSDEAAVVRQLRGCCAVIAGAEPYTAGMLQRITDLRVIARTGVGYDAVDLAAADEASIAVTITPGVNHHAVAEHAIAMLMGLARGFPLYDRRMRQGDWTRRKGPRVMGSTLGLLGLGRIGQAMVPRAAGLGLKVLVSDPFASSEFVEAYGLESVSQEELFARSDFLSLHAPATVETTHVINAASIAQMKDSAILINTSRGPLIHEDDLVAALSTGKLRGAGLDVFQDEPLSIRSPLLQLDNVMLSPHVAGQDDESHEDTFTMAARNIIDLHAGRRPTDNLVNLHGVPDWTWIRS